MAMAMLVQEVAKMDEMLLTGSYQRFNGDKMLRLVWWLHNSAGPLKWDLFPFEFGT